MAELPGVIRDICRAEGLVETLKTVIGWSDTMAAPLQHSDTLLPRFAISGSPFSWMRQTRKIRRFMAVKGHQTMRLRSTPGTTCDWL